MTYLELVKEYFPGISDAEADYILWKFTAFPVVKGEDELRVQLKEFKEGRGMKRYNMHVPPYSNSATPIENPEGKWVKHEDVEAEITCLGDELYNLQEDIRGLLAQNDKLKKLNREIKTYCSGCGLAISHDSPCPIIDILAKAEGEVPPGIVVGYNFKKMKDGEGE